MAKPTIASLTARIQELETEIERLKAGKRTTKGRGDPKFIGTFDEADAYAKKHTSDKPLLQRHGDQFAVYH